MARRAPTTATKGLRRAWTFLAYLVACLPLIPAIRVNIDAAHSGSDAWAWAAAGSIVMGAVFFEASLLVRGFFRSAGLMLLSVAIVLVNLQNAMNNASATSDHRSDHRRTAIQAAQNLSSQRSQWSQGRSEQAKVAGETAVAAIQAEIDSTIASDAGRWRATDECSPLRISAGQSKAFCSAIADMKAKLAAAQKRDELDAKIAALDARGAVADVPAVVDPYVENVVMLLSFAGVVDTPVLRRIIAASKDWTRSLALELMAVFGPSAILIIMLSSRRRDEPEPEVEKPAKAAKALPPAPVHATPAAPAPAQPDAEALPSDDPIHAFIASQLEECVGEHIRAGDLWAMGQDWYRERDLSIGSQRSFGLKLKAAGLAWEPNNNRPRYLNVRRKAPAKAEQPAPSLRVVAGTG